MSQIEPILNETSNFAKGKPLSSNGAPSEVSEPAVEAPNASGIQIQSLESAQLIPIEWIQLNPHQFRNAVNETGVEELALSIRDVGVFEPLLVTRRGRKRFIVIAGHRRLEAAKRAGLDAVPCVVLDLSDGEFLHYSLIENLQRANLEPFEEAAAIKQLIELTGFTYREVAAKLGKSVAFVSERLALMEMPKDVEEYEADA